MSSIMTKRGNQDNIVTYEFICDTAADLAAIDPQYITIGSVAVIIDGLEVYIANSKKQWVGLNTTTPEESD